MLYDNFEYYTMLFFNYIKDSTHMYHNPLTLHHKPETPA